MAEDKDRALALIDELEPWLSGMAQLKLREIRSAVLQIVVRYEVVPREGLEPSAARF